MAPIVMRIPHFATCGARIGRIAIEFLSPFFSSADVNRFASFAPARPRVAARSLPVFETSISPQYDAARNGKIPGQLSLAECFLQNVVEIGPVLLQETYFL